MNKAISLIIFMVLVLGTFTKAQITIEPSITHRTPTVEYGEISLDVSGGMEPYIYKWKKLWNTPLDWNTSQVSGIEKNGIYSVTVTDANAVTAKKSIWLGNIGLFDNLTNLDVNGNVYSKSAESSADYGIAISSNIMPKSAWTWFEAEITDVESEMMIGFVDAAKGDLKFGFRLLPDAEKTLEIMQDGKVISRHHYAIGDKLKINHQKGSKRMDYHLGGIVAQRRNYEVLPSLKLGLFVKDGPGVALNWHTYMNFTKKPIKSNYTKLKKKLDGSFVQTFYEPSVVVTGPSGDYSSIPGFFLRFTYKERYNIVVGENDMVEWTIYDWKRQVVMGGGGQTNTMNSKYGTNWQKIDVENLIPGEFYTLEIKGINKDEKYYLRFRR